VEGSGRQEAVDGAVTSRAGRGVGRRYQARRDDERGRLRLGSTGACVQGQGAPASGLALAVGAPGGARPRWPTGETEKGRGDGGSQWALEAGRLGFRRLGRLAWLQGFFSLSFIF